MLNNFSENLKNSNRAVIVTGGDIDNEMVMECLSEGYAYLCAVDGGLKVLDALSYVPDYIVGDFDTVDIELVNTYRSKTNVIVEQHEPMKDDTDTQLAVKKLSQHYKEILIL